MNMSPPATGSADALCELLRLAGVAAVLVDAAGDVVAVNAAAQACMGASLHIRNRRLAAADPRANRALTRLIQEVARCGWAPPDDQIVVGRRNARPLIVRAVPLGGPTRSLFHPARAMVLVLDASRAALPTERQLGSILGLSAAEAQLARRLAAGDSLDTAAQVCGISYETARKRIKAVFEKTDTHRQAELVALLIRLGSIAGSADHAVTPRRAWQPGTEAPPANADRGASARRSAARPAAPPAHAEPALQVHAR